MSAADSMARLRAVRSFVDRSLAEDDVAAIVEAGRRTASSKNAQQREFVVVRDRERLRSLAGVGPWAGHLAGAAAAIAIVTPDPHASGVRLTVAFDAGLAAEAMMLAAWERGVGSCPVTVYEQDLCRSILGHPSDRWCGWLLSMGYPADPAELSRPNRPGGRRPLSDLVHDERW